MSGDKSELKHTALQCRKHYTQRKQRLINHLHFRHNAYCKCILLHPMVCPTFSVDSQPETCTAPSLSPHRCRQLSILCLVLSVKRFNASSKMVPDLSSRKMTCSDAVSNTYLGSRSSWGPACARSGRVAALVREWLTAQVQTGNPQIWWHWTHDLSAPSRHLETNTPKSKI